MAVKTREELEGKIVVIECAERLDAGMADEFRTTMKDLVNQENYLLVIDLAKTQFVDSSGLGALVSRIAVTRSNQGDVRLASVNETIAKLLEMTHLDQVFKTYDDVESAIESFAK